MGAEADKCLLEKGIKKFIFLGFWVTPPALFVPNGEMAKRFSPQISQIITDFCFYGGGLSGIMRVKDTGMQVYKYVSMSVYRDAGQF